MMDGITNNAPVAEAGALDQKLPGGKLDAGQLHNITVSPPINISNTDFLQGIFGDQWSRSYVSSFLGAVDDAGAGDWMGTYASTRIGDWPNNLEDALANQFFTVSLFGDLGDGKAKRTKKFFQEQRCLVIDDLGLADALGAKASIDVLIGKLVPSWILETSPGNYQIGYIYRAGYGDADLMDRLVTAMIRDGLGLEADPGMRSVSRIVRMPRGRNTKRKYGGEWDCKLRSWNPGLRYTVEEIVSSWGLTLDAPRHNDRWQGSGRGGSVGDGENFVMKVLDHLGFIGPAQGSGFVSIPCPNMGSHTIQDGRTGFNPDEGFSCFHGSCQHLGSKDLVDWLKADYPEAWQAVKAEVHTVDVQVEFKGYLQPIPVGGVPVPAVTNYVIPSENFPQKPEYMERLFSDLGERQVVFRNEDMLLEVGPDKTRMRKVKPERFQAILTEQRGVEVMAWKMDRDGIPVLKEKNPSRAIASQVMNSTFAGLLPQVSSTSRLPVLADIGDGCPTLLGKGHHYVAGGLLVFGDLDLPEMSLERAVQLIKIPFAGFAYHDLTDASRALAGLITPALQAGDWYNGPTPVQLYRADHSQAGKSRHVNITVAAYGEKKYLLPLKENQQGVGSVEETISGGIVSKARFPYLDNIRGELSSPILEAAVTATVGDVIKARPPGGSVDVTIGHTCWQATGNNLIVTRDLANRSNIINIVKQPDDYNFPILTGARGQRLLPEHWVSEYLGHYLGAIYRVVRQWVTDGRQVCGGLNVSRHSFPEWAAAVDYIIPAYFGLPEPTEGLKEIQEQASDAAGGWITKLFRVIEEKRQLGFELKASDLAEWSKDAGLKPDIPSALGRKMGALFGGGAGHILQYDEFSLTRISRKWESDATKTTKTYIFRRH